MIADFFKLDQHETNVRQEVIASVTTFLTMSYIIAVNPNILADAGMNKEALITVTALSAIFGTLFMGLWINVPLTMAPGIRLTFGFLSFIVIKIAVGRIKDISLIMWGIGILSALNLILTI